MLRCTVSLAWSCFVVSQSRTLAFVCCVQNGFTGDWAVRPHPPHQAPPRCARPAAPADRGGVRRWTDSVPNHVVSRGEIGPALTRACRHHFPPSPRRSSEEEQDQPHEEQQQRRRDRPAISRPSPLDARLTRRRLSRVARARAVYAVYAGYAISTDDLSVVPSGTTGSCPTLIVAERAVHDAPPLFMLFMQ